MKRMAKYAALVAVVAAVVVLSFGLTASTVPENHVGSTPLEANSPADPETRREVATAQPASPLETAWPYVELDPEEVRKRGHEAHHVGSCAYGSFEAIVGLLQEKIGAPYDQVPTYMLHFGRGGVSGSGSACGAVLGSLTAINLIAGEDYKPLASELVTYYETSEFPTDEANQYAVDGEYTAHEYLDKRLPQSVAGSINCEDSRGAWVEVSGYEMSSAERHERCSRLTGDVAAKAVQVLNEWHADRLVKVADPEAELANIFPRATFEQVEGHVHRALENDRVVGYAGISEAAGYKDNIVMAVGIGLDGRVEGAHVIRHNETSGIGSKITDEEFLSRFEGLSADEIRLQAEGGRIDALSGATVSSETATKIVREQVETLQGYLD